jgi:hypothetical protein
MLVNPVIQINKSGPFASRAEAILTTIPAIVQVLETSGYYAAGDGGGGIHTRQAVAPARGSYFQTLDGAYWLYQPDEMGYNIRAFGARPAPDLTAELYAAANATAIQGALNAVDTDTEGAFSVYVPDGLYWVTGAGARILEIQDQTKFYGNALERALIVADDATTAPIFIQDDGSAVKIEIYNITFYGNDNANITSGVNLGNRGTVFGTYGSIDNVMVRNLPNGAGYKLKCNIVACGRLYTIDCQDGVLSQPGSVGFHAETVNVIGYSGIGVQSYDEDYIGWLECEGPASDGAISWELKGNAAAGGFINSIGLGIRQKTVVRVDPALVNNFSIAALNKLRATNAADHTQDARWGNYTTPYDTGVLTAVGAATATIAGKNWEPDSLIGGAVWVTAGTGSNNNGTWAIIASNTKDTITVLGSWASWTVGPYVAPVIGSTIAIDGFITRLGGGVPWGAARGIATDSISSKTGSFNAATVNTLANTTLNGKTVIADTSLKVGSLAASATFTNILRATASIDIPNIAAGGTQTVTFAMAGAQAGTPVFIGLPNGLNAGISLDKAWLTADTVNMTFRNNTGAGIDPAALTFAAIAFTT